MEKLLLEGIDFNDFYFKPIANTYCEYFITDINIPGNCRGVILSVSISLRVDEIIVPVIMKSNVED
jgi:hypothetical protein